MQLQLAFEREFGGGDDLALLVDQMAVAVEAALKTSFPAECYNVIVASGELMRQLNRDFRQVDSVTDVLSFPLGPENEINGEIYICWPKVLSQAQEYGHSRQREFAYLLAHGILHLLGYDHGAEPNPAMRAMEESILARMNLRRV